ncbi:unnamed protein product [Caenorhabditis brenneri]
MHTHFRGYDKNGQPLMKTFYHFEDMIVDDELKLQVANERCAFNVIGPEDMLMQCDGKLFRVQSERVNILDTNSELFTFDHVLNQIYIYRHGQILRLQPHNKTRAVKSVQNLKDFNVVGGLITHLYNDGTICHNNTIIDKIDMANHTRLPIYVAPKHVPTTENTFEGVPDVELLKEHKEQRNIVVCDDLMNFFARDRKALQLLNDLFCLYAHHMNCAIFNLVQSAFALPPTTRSNSTYIILMKNLSDAAQVKNLLVQQFGDKWRAAFEAYQDIMSKPYQAMLINNDPLAHSSMRILSNFVDDYPIAHVPI